MKNSHLTLRLPADLARALARWARARGVPKSLVVREAVTRYLNPAAAVTSPVTAGELAIKWPLLPRLTREEADSLDADIVAARRELPPLAAPWE
jgi:predicted transcriptional regulator